MPVTACDECINEMHRVMLQRSWDAATSGRKGGQRIFLYKEENIGVEISWLRVSQ